MSEEVEEIRKVFRLDVLVDKQRIESLLWLIERVPRPEDYNFIKIPLLNLLVQYK